MSIKLTIPEQNMIQLKPRICVFGVGGGGGNAINNMISKNLEGVDFVVANTDSQALANSKANCRIQLGLETTRGLGAGANPEVGKLSAEEAINEIEKQLENVNMVFITAGMGGGTGSGAAPVIAKLAREKGILTVGVVTKPFLFEGKKRSETANKSIEEFSKTVDSIIIIPNQNLFRIADKNTTLADAFVMADNVLYSGIRSITDLMIMPGLINLDFADVKSIMEDKGKAIMGTGEADGENRAVVAAQQALSNPLLDDCSVIGAQGVLINITGGSDITLFEIDEAANRIKEEVSEDANIIFGSSYDDSLLGKIRVSIVATGISTNPTIKAEPKSKLIVETLAKPEVDVFDEVRTSNLEKFSATKTAEQDLQEVIDDLEFISEKTPDNIDIYESSKEKEIETEIQIQKEINHVEKNQYVHTEIESHSNIAPEMPKASSLFKAIVSKPETPYVDNQFEIALAANQGSFAPRSQIREIEEDLELFPNHNQNSFSQKKEEPVERLIIDEDDYTPTLIERVTGFSIAKRNKKREEERKEREQRSPALDLDDNRNFGENKLNLEIPSFLRRK